MFKEGKGNLLLLEGGGRGSWMRGNEGRFE